MRFYPFIKLFFELTVADNVQRVQIMEYTKFLENVSAHFKRDLRDDSKDKNHQCEASNIAERCSNNIKYLIHVSSASIFAPQLGQ